MSLNFKIKNALDNHQVLKFIVGLDNFSISDTIKKVKSAEIGGATYVDIAANPKLVNEVKRISCLPVCVSSIDISELSACFKAGADILEIGNFDCFYSKGIFFTSTQILDLTIKLIKLEPLASVCVTIPHTLNLSDQVRLAKKLEKVGVNLIQTEGCISHTGRNTYCLNGIQEASSSLSSTYAFAQHVNIPIISSSGICPLSIPIALSCGASGVGIASYFSQFNNALDLSLGVRTCMNAILSNHHISQMNLLNTCMDNESSCLNLYTI